jgi:hypothetical protein
MTKYFGAGTTEVLTFLGITSGTVQSDLGLLDVQITDALDRAKREIQERTKTHFAAWDASVRSGTALVSGTTQPDYIIVNNEVHNGQGKFNREYYTIRYPLPNITAITTGTVVPSSGTVEVVSTKDFPSSGTIGTSSNKITYSYVAGTAFCGCAGITGTVSPSSTIVPYVFEISTDDQGNAPTWQIQTIDDEFNCDSDTGRFYLYKTDVPSSLYARTNPPDFTPNRIRISYCYGWSPDSSGNVPRDVTRLIIMIACRDLMHMIVRKSTLAGLNSFNPRLIDVDDKLIDETIGRYQNPLFGNNI